MNVKLEQKQRYYSTFDNMAVAFVTLAQLFFQTPHNNMICLENESWDDEIDIEFDPPTGIMKIMIDDATTRYCKTMWDVYDAFMYFAQFYSKEGYESDAAKELESACADVVTALDYDHTHIGGYEVADSIYILEPKMRALVKDLHFKFLKRRKKQTTFIKDIFTKFIPYRITLISDVSLGWTITNKYHLYLDYNITPTYSHYCVTLQSTIDTQYNRTVNVSSANEALFYLIKFGLFASIDNPMYESTTLPDFVSQVNMFYNEINEWLEPEMPDSNIFGYAYEIIKYVPVYPLMDFYTQYIKHTDKHQIEWSLDNGATFTSVYYYEENIKNKYRVEFRQHNVGQGWKLIKDVSSLDEAAFYILKTMAKYNKNNQIKNNKGVYTNE